MQFNILQNDPNLKHLGQFFKVLTNLWVHEDFVEGFENYINQLNTIITELFKMDEATMKTLPNVKRELLKLFYILKGIVTGLNTQKNFALFFDWFYPEYFPLIGKSLTAFIHDDEMVLIIFKFLGELVNNRCSRLRFDTWNINGLIVFKEAAKISIQYL
jgi:exportin-7